MLVKLIAELNPKFMVVPNMKLEIINEESDANTFYVFVYNRGRSSMTIYELSIIEASSRADSDNMKMETGTISSHLLTRWDCELTYLASFELPFPIHFVIHSSQNIWAIGHYEHTDVKCYLNETIRKKKPNRKRKAMQSDSTDPSKMVYSGKMKSNFEYIAPVNICMKKNLVVNNNPVCYVEKFLDAGLLFCRVNVFCHCWSIQAITSDKKTLLSSSVPFQYDCLNRSEMDFNQKGLDDYSRNKPVLRFVQAGSIDDTRSCCSLTTRSFTSFFGPEILSLSSAVILFGTPNGQILWQPVLFQSPMSKDVSKFQVLCDIEQPVKDIHICSEIWGQDLIIIIGVYGKVMILSSKICQLHKQDKNISHAFTVLVSYIPSPVHDHILINTTIYHISSNGELWSSVLQKNETECCCKDKMYHSSSTECCRLLHVKSLISSKGLILLITFDGHIYLGQLFQNQNSFGNKNMKFPPLLESGYQVSQQLCDLESVETKQKKILSHLTVLKSLKQHGDWKKNGICSVKEVNNNKLLISMSLSYLKNLNLEPDLCFLTASVSRCFNQKSVSIKKQWSYNTGHDFIFWELDFSIWPFSSYLTFPWLLEVGLNFDVPKIWKELGYFQLFALEVPQYFKLITVFVNEFLLLQKKEVLPLPPYMSKRDKSNTFTKLRNLCSMKSISNFSRIGVEEQQLAWHSAFSGSIQLSSCSTQILSEIMGPAVYSEVLKYFTSRKGDEELPVKLNFVCHDYSTTLSIIKNGNFLLLRFETDNFKLLINLKTFIMHLLLVSEESKNVAHSKRFEVSRNVCQKIMLLSQKLADLLSMDDILLKMERLENQFNLYKYLRDEITSKLFL